MSIGGGLAVAFGGAAALGAETRLLVVVTAALAGVFGYGLNAYLVLREPPHAVTDRMTDAARRADPAFDHRSLLEVVRDFRAEGVPAVPYLIGSFALDEDLDPPLLPIVGVSTATTVLCNENGPYTVYAADEHGFNNPAGWPEAVDVAVVGDSFVQGQCVGPGEDIAGQLRKLGYTALNLGVSGHGPLFELAALLEYGVARSPKAVIWVWSGNDYGNLRREMASPMLRRYLEPGFTQRLTERQGEVDAYWRDYIEREGLLEPRAPAPQTPGQVDVRDLLTLRSLRSLMGLRRGDDDALVERQLAEILRTAQAAIRAGGGELYFVDLPHYEIATTPPEAIGDVTQDLACHAAGVPQIEFHEVLYATEDPHAYFPYGLPGHYNAAGYALLAKTIAAAIEGDVPRSAER